MNRIPPDSPGTESLTREERALGEQLTRLGPHDGPSPALDARILGAARAVAGRPVRARRKRWLALTGVPASMITGVGLAASLILAIGVVWQLRPLPAMLPAAREVMADDGFVAAQPVKSRKPRINAPAPPPPETDEAAALGAKAPSPASSRVAAPAGATAPAQDASASQAASAASVASTPAQVADAVADASPARADQEAAAMSQRAAEPARTSAPSPPPTPAAPTRRASYTNSARALSGSSERESAARDRATAKADSAPATRAESDDATLDRFEVTGSRLRTVDDLTEADEATLAPVDWLLRVRELRAAGELEAARASLARFRRAHPRLHLPDDLRALENPPLDR